MTKKLDLSMVTLLCVETRDSSLGEWAIEKCITHASFRRVVLITNLANIRFKKVGIEYLQAPPLQFFEEYSKFMMGNLSQYALGTHVFIIQWDSFITNPELWDEKFLEYDYIGAVWPHHPLTPVGNGGFSLRSVKLLKALSDPQIKVGHPEDYYICVENKYLLESKFGIRIAPAWVAEKFSVERTAWHSAFGFHGLFNFSKTLEKEDLKKFIQLVPRNLLNSIDTYDLLDSLWLEKKYYLFKILCNKIVFKFRYRKRYIISKLRHIYCIYKINKDLIN
jgi:hypothetical protein